MKDITKSGTAAVRIGAVFMLSRSSTSYKSNFWRLTKMFYLFITVSSFYPHESKVYLTSENIIVKEDFYGKYIYGGYLPVLEQIKAEFIQRIENYTAEEYEKTGIRIYEHLTGRVKSEDSMTEKCSRHGLDMSPHSALKEPTDSIGIRIICSFIDDIYANIARIKAFPDCTVVKEKDYIRHAKPNGYRSYHMILEYTAPIADIDGNDPGTFFIEIQLRTIAMDSWASLEHKLKYKKHIENQELIVAELKRCADELASCDLSMSTIRELIEKS